ncbi:M48 family metallopeptidase [Azospirillum sp. RWY-5-1]|uniref:M48 family metallopeptidase n=1 Tax=Azospirillum oleiclasticum TaxID=2735135 RepID=A0ABX2TAM2_9PROT|nr:SprT family zinc-dependent metalloprotease [Azospirillum oleiclasticum]NYZ15249.1 M48 family metallopeptidase [Azospirillum oleiclasticum]NYZ21330.1 M48 family metallopeptidase [Azospirillum oleiclasticum]
MTSRRAARSPRALLIAGLPAPLELRESTRTRRLTLRVDAGRGLIQVVVPPGLPEAEVRRFVTRHDGWVRDRLAALPPQLPFADGAVVPVLGVDHVIRHSTGHSGGTRREDGAILVGGQPEHLRRRVLDHLVAEARRELAARAREKAALIGARVAAVTVRDTRSRWGSCSATGRLSFSWRLIMTPEPVLDYVVAHEVAHLKELNHSPRFWAVCAGLTPDVKGPRSWLKTNGARLLRYG